MSKPKRMTIWQQGEAFARKYWPWGDKSGTRLPQSHLDMRNSLATAFCAGVVSERRRNKRKAVRG